MTMRGARGLAARSDCGGLLSAREAHGATWRCARRGRLDVSCNASVGQRAARRCVSAYAPGGGSGPWLSLAERAVSDLGALCRKTRAKQRGRRREPLSAWRDGAIALGEHATDRGGFPPATWF